MLDAVNTGQTDGHPHPAQSPLAVQSLVGAGHLGEPPGAVTQFESFLAEISSRFTGVPGDRVDAEIERALRDLVEFLGTDRATLMEFFTDGASLRPTHSWARAPGEPYPTPTR